MNQPLVELWGNERFQLTDRIGRGGMGEVHRAYDRKTSKWVALKTITDVDPTSVQQFKKEFYSASDLEHPNLIQLQEFFEDDGRCFFSMELIDGQDFLSYVRSDRDSFDETRLRQCLSQVVDGIVALHRYGKVHRDLKPSNILVESDGRLVILDFGVAAEVVGGRQIGDIGAVGTIAYMAPEQSVGMPVSAAVDWYALGVILYQSLAGRLPFEGSLYKMRMDQQLSNPRPPSQYAPDAPPDLVSLCVDLLNYDPRARPKGRDVLKRLHIDHSWLSEKLFSPGGAETYTEFISYVGRKKELEVLHTALEQSLIADPVSILIVGEAGAGKTALAREFLTQAMVTRQNLVVFSGKFQKNTSFRFQVFESLVSDLCDRLIDLNIDTQEGKIVGEKTRYDLMLTPMEATAVLQVFSTLMRVPFITRASSLFSHETNPASVRLLAFQAIRKLLQVLTKKYVLILCLDDIQWANKDSLDLLREIAYPDEALPFPLLLVATMRTGPDNESELTDILPGRKQLLLGRLSDEEVAELSGSMFQIHNVPVPSEEKLAALAKEAEGHPLFVLELSRWLMSGEDITAGRLEEMLWSRIQRLGEKTRLLLELISLAGVSLDYETLADAAEIDLDECTRRVSHLFVDNLVRSAGDSERDFIEPYHDKIHEVIAERIDRETAKKRHRRLASAIGFRADRFDQSIVVDQLLKAGATREAGKLAVGAANKAADALAFGQVANLLKAAIRFGEHTTSERQELLMRLGDALCAVGQGEAASKVYLEARQGASATTGFHLWCRAAEQLVLAGQLKQGQDELKSLLTQKGENLNTGSVRTLFSLVFRRAVLKLRGLHWKQTDEGLIDPTKLMQIDIYQFVAEILSAVDNVLGADYQARRLLAALRSGETGRIGLALAMESTYVSSQGTKKAFKRAQDLIDKANLIADEKSSDYLKAKSNVCSGMVKYFEGYLKEANQMILNSEKAFIRIHTRHSFVPVNARIFRARILRFMGDFQQLWASAETYMREAKRHGDKYLETNIRYLRTQGWLAQDLPKEALRDLEMVEWIPPEERYHLQHWYRTSARSDVALYEGTAAKDYSEFMQYFEEMRKSLLLRMGIYRAEYYWLKGRFLVAAAAELSPKRSRSMLRQAHNICKKLTIKNTGCRLAEVWSPILLAAISHQKNDQELSVFHLKTAIEQAEETPHIAAAAKRRLGQILGGRGGSEVEHQGTDWMKRNGIFNPDAMTELLLPGFGNPSQPAEISDSGFAEGAMNAR